MCRKSMITILLPVFALGQVMARECSWDSRNISEIIMLEVHYQATVGGGFETTGSEIQ